MQIRNRVETKWRDAETPSEQAGFRKHRNTAEQASSGPDQWPHTSNQDTNKN